MINVDRSTTVPESLDTHEIRQYLDKFAEYKVDQEKPKEYRTVDKPKCNTVCRNLDLFEIFDECFFKKCYLTEEVFNTSWEMDVEHFVSRDEQPELKYKWTNLYPASHDANMMKPRSTPKGGYLDPCDPNDDVEGSIRYFFKFLTEDVSFEAVDLSNLKAVNTAKLLDKVHNGDKLETQLKRVGLKTAIRKKYVNVVECITEWQKACLDGDRDEEFRLKNILKGLLSRKASFTMLIRSTRRVKALPAEFFD